MTCRFPMWPDGERPTRRALLDGTAYCGAPAKPGSSYCEEHHAKCWWKPPADYLPAAANVFGAGARNGKRRGRGRDK